MINVKMKPVTDRQVREAARAIRGEVTAALAAWDAARLAAARQQRPDLAAVYAAFERAQQAAFDAKDLFALEIRPS